jgi:LysM repeat protein
MQGVKSHRGFIRSSSMKIALILLVASLALTGCFRPASTPLASPLVVPKVVVTPAATSSSLVSDILKQTQTVAALSSTEVPAATKETPEAVVEPTKKIGATDSGTSDNNNNDGNGNQTYKRDPNPPRPNTYTIQPGEWPYCIARRYNLSVGTLLSINGLGNDSRPPAGTVLKIPQDGTWDSGDRALHPHPTTYTVKSGDTIYIIACYFGDLLPEDIVEANGLQSDALEVGQTLEIP